MNSLTRSRRDAIRNLAGLIASSPLLHAQKDLPDTGLRHPAIDDIANIFEMEAMAKERIPRANWDYIAGGVDNEWTLRRNREMFDKVIFRPRMLANTEKMDLSTELFGTKIATPILTAPSAGHQQAHPDGEIATAKAAAARGTIICLSINSSFTPEKVAAATPAAKWWQLYMREDLDSSRDRVEQAMKAGFKAIVFTVDGPYNSHRERLLRGRIRSTAPPGMTTRRRAAEPHPYGLEPVLVHKLDWTFLATLKTWARVPVLVKGILTPEDAALAVKHGADGIVVSNHGGRYLDYAPSSIEVLPEIVQSVGGRIPILIDSGFRRGTDVLKALAIGAKAVMIGRPVFWGLGSFGQAGVEKVLQLMTTELALAMGLSGKATLASLDRSLVRIEP